MARDKRFLRAPYQIHINDDQANSSKIRSTDGVANDYVVSYKTETHQMSPTENRTKQNKTKLD